MDAVVHFELPYDDAQRVARFYTAAFGWKMQQLGPEMGHYVLCITAEQDARPDGQRGAINGGCFPRSAQMPSQHPSVVIGVRDIAASSRAVDEAGGKVLGTPMEIPGVGLYVAFNDTEGNRLSMLQPQRQAGA